LQVRVGQVTLQPPFRPATDPGVWLEPLAVWAIWLHEPTPPAQATPVEWLLLTNVAIQTWADVTERIGWYCVCPGIESFHKVLKSGCTVEDCRLEDAERLKPYLTLMSVVVWRLFWLTQINRQNPEAACTTMLADHEWKALYTTIHRTPVIPARPPSVRQAIRWICQLGGFLGRTDDGQPDITTLWRGWSILGQFKATFAAELCFGRGRSQLRTGRWLLRPPAPCQEPMEAADRAPTGQV
jgi:hypothetical protein